MKFSAKIVDCIQLLTIYLYGVSQGYEYACDKAKQNPGVLSFIPQKIRATIPTNFFHF